MKKLIKVAAFLLVLFNVSCASAQIFVKVRPIVPVIVITQQPSPTHVWIDEEWEPEGNGYRYVGGYWSTPPQRGYKWKKGEWKEHENGHHWKKGGWKKNK